MKKGDYKSIAQAKKYHQGRFNNGLEIVNLDEMSIFDKWLAKIPVKQKVILDIGTGTGRAINSLLNYNTKKIYALDQSQAMLHLLSKIYTEEIKKGRVESINASSQRIPLSSNSVDLITAFHLLKHLPNIEPTLREINKVLKPGGYFIFDILNINSLIKFNLGTCYAMTETQIKYTLVQRGFTIKAVVYMHSLGETVYGIFGKMLGTVPYTFDKLFSMLGLKLGTKIFILAQKNKQV